MSFAYPFWLWLIPVLVWIQFRFFRSSGPHHLLRTLLIVCALLVLSAPRFNSGGKGTDLILLFDESLSVPEKDRKSYAEFARTINQFKGKGDRLSIVRFGSEIKVEKTLEDPKFPGEWQEMGQQHRSDISKAVTIAISMVPEDRAGRIVVFTDGEFSEGASIEAAQAAAAKRISIDVWNLAKPEVADAAVLELQTPGTISPGAPFQFTGWIQSSVPGEVTYELRRNKQVLTRGNVTVNAGVTPVLLRDLIQDEGVHGYELIITGREVDRIPENNRARSVVQVHAQQKVLLVTKNTSGNIARILQANKIPFEVVSPQHAPSQLNLEKLSSCMGVIVDNVNSEALTPDGMQAIKKFCKGLGGGFLMTGGRESFAMGGYYHSPIEDCLPVSLEVRKEIRKNRISVAIALDRSGSMAAPVGGGLQKMDLANNGTVEAIRMLGPLDRISVIAVDSEAHIIVPLTAADDTSRLIKYARSIRSEGGGIYVYEALDAAYNQVRSSDTTLKHVILFADAADSEEPGDYVTLMAQMRSENISISVIGLGRETDVDAWLLKDIARRGNGRIFFTDRAEELPRLFSYEMVLADKSAYLENPMDIKQTSAGLSVLSELPKQLPSPALAAYNLAYPKPQGQTAWLTTEEDPTVLWAFGHMGIGRSTALMFDIDGKDSQNLQASPGFSSFLGAVLRWSMESGGNPDAHLELTRDGNDVTAILDVSESLSEKLKARPVLLVMEPQSNGDPTRMAFREQPDGTWRARFPLEHNGIYHVAANLGELGVVRAAPVVIPFSPELRFWEERHSRQRVQHLTSSTGGVIRTQLNKLFESPAFRPTGLDLRPLLLILLLVGWVMEISMRRLFYGQYWPRWIHVKSLRRKPASVRVKKNQPEQTEALKTETVPSKTMSPVLPTAATTPKEKVEPPANTTLDALSKLKQKKAGKK